MFSIVTHRNWISIYCINSDYTQSCTWHIVKDKKILYMWCRKLCYMLCTGITYKNWLYLMPTSWAFIACLVPAWCPLDAHLMPAWWALTTHLMSTYVTVQFQSNHHLSMTVMHLSHEPIDCSVCVVKNEVGSDNIYTQWLPMCWPLRWWNIHPDRKLFGTMPYAYHAF